LIKYELIQVQNILNQIDGESDEFPSVYTLNPYRGCEHACQYCYVMSEKYIPYKKKEEFFYKIQSKTNAPFLVKEALQKISKDCLIMIGSACDPYQPAEKEYKNTRSILGVIYEFKNPIHIMTKSDLILRDIDLLQKISAQTFLAVSISIAMDDELSKIFEPRSVKPSKRFNTINVLSSKGIRCGVAVAPIFPYIIKEKMIEDIISKASLMGAKYIFVDDLRLRDTNKIRFIEFLKEFYPKLIGRYEIIYSKHVSPPAAFSRDIIGKMKKMIKELGLDTTFTGKFRVKKKQMNLF
jgi:DNA repair photolyase